jgi:hypothetical protein
LPPIVPARTMQRMARAQAKTGDITIRMDPLTRARIDRLAERKGLATGQLLRTLGLETAERYEAADRLRRALDEMEPDDESTAPVKRRRAGRRK